MSIQFSLLNLLNGFKHSDSHLTMKDGVQNIYKELMLSSLLAKSGWHSH